MSPSAKIDRLYRLTGLTPDELADALETNPRCYMNLKGAVAERHLDKALASFHSKGAFTEYRRGHGDFEKDYYLTVPGKRKAVAVECKNVEVLPHGTLSRKRLYLTFLKVKHYDLGLPEVEALEQISGRQIQDLFEALPAEYRDSGLSRYSFSRNLADIEGPIGRSTAAKYLHRFDEFPLTIDFQRTRNSRDSGDTNNKANRLYRVGEIDIVAACMFSRTLEWDFIYGLARQFRRDEDSNDRYSNSVVIDPDRWATDLPALMRLL